MSARANGALSTPMPNSTAHHARVYIVVLSTVRVDCTGANRIVRPGQESRCDRSANSARIRLIKTRTNAPAIAPKGSLLTHQTDVRLAMPAKAAATSAIRRTRHIDDHSFVRAGSNLRRTDACAPDPVDGTDRLAFDVD